MNLVEIDERSDKMRLSRKALLEKPEGYVEPPARERREDGGDRRGGGGYGGRR